MRKLNDFAFGPQKTLVFQIRQNEFIVVVTLWLQPLHAHLPRAGWTSGPPGDRSSIGRAAAKPAAKTQLLVVCSDPPSIARASLEHRPSSRQIAVTSRVLGSPEHRPSIARAAAKTQLLVVFWDLPSRPCLPACLPCLCLPASAWLPGCLSACVSLPPTQPRLSTTNPGPAECAKRLITEADGRQVRARTEQGLAFLDWEEFLPIRNALSSSEGSNECEVGNVGRFERPTPSSHWDQVHLLDGGSGDHG